MSDCLVYLTHIGHVSDEIRGCTVCTSDGVMQEQAMQGSEELRRELSGGSLVEVEMGETASGGVCAASAVAGDVVETCVLAMSRVSGAIDSGCGWTVCTNALDNAHDSS